MNRFTKLGIVVAGYVAGILIALVTVWVRILIAPLLALGFSLAALLSPYRSHRRALFSATLMEAAVTAYGAVTWFLPLFLDLLPR